MFYLMTNKGKQKKETETMCMLVRAICLRKIEAYMTIIIYRNHLNENEKKKYIYAIDNMAWTIY